jgi:hypothetical protein
VTGNSINNTGPLISGTTGHNVCTDACLEDCPL